MINDPKKDRERADRIECKMKELLKQRNQKRFRLAEYIEACESENIIDHMIRAKSANSFYIHPHGVSGPTLDFFLASDGQVLCDPETERGDAHD